jgi:hypothetical protein
MGKTLKKREKVKSCKIPLLLFCFADSVIGSNINGACIHGNVKKKFTI